MSKSVQPDCNKNIRPLLKKLKKCRDPDRADLVALQRSRREQTARREQPAEAKAADAAVFGGESEEAREAKRRKVALEDPFGPPL